MVTKAVGIADDDYEDKYFKLQLDVLPEVMEEEELKNATDVSVLKYW